MQSHRWPFLATGTWRICPWMPTVNVVGVLVCLAALGIVVHVSTLNCREDTYLRSSRLLCMLVSLSSTRKKSEASWSSQSTRHTGSSSRWNCHCWQLALRFRWSRLRYGLDLTGENFCCTLHSFPIRFLPYFFGYYYQANFLTIILLLDWYSPEHSWTV